MEISKSDLFARLGEGHAARITVVTPNRRLAQSLMAQFDAHQAVRGLAAWEAPDILPLDAFVVRLWEDALYSEQELPLLLTAAQEQSLGIDENVALLALDQLGRIKAGRIDPRPPFSALLTLWLSMMQAVGLASRSAFSRHLTYSS